MASAKYSGVESAPAIANAHAYVPTINNSIHALDLKNGSTDWKIKNRVESRTDVEPIESVVYDIESPSVDEISVYYHVQDERRGRSVYVKKVNLETGKIVKTVMYVEKPTSSPIICN